MILLIVLRYTQFLPDIALATIIVSLLFDFLKVFALLTSQKETLLRSLTRTHINNVDRTHLREKKYIFSLGDH